MIKLWRLRQGVTDREAKSMFFEDVQDLYYQLAIDKETGDKFLWLMDEAPMLRIDSTILKDFRKYNKTIVTIIHGRLYPNDMKVYKIGKYYYLDDVDFEKLF